MGIYALLLCGGNYRSWIAIGRADPVQFEPTGPATLLSGPLAPALNENLIYLMLVLNVVFVLGLFHRVLGPIYGALVCFVLAYRNSWGMVYHVDNLWVMHIMILGLVPAASAWSLDSWIQRLRSSGHLPVLQWPPAPERVHWWYGWPIHLMCAVTMITYFLAGVAKVNGEAGWRWALGSNLRDQIAYDALYKELIDLEGASAAIWFIYDHPEALIPAATLALVLELGAPLALLNRRLGQVYSFGLIGMHWGIKLSMRLTFPYPIYGVAFLSFFRPERWVASLQTGAARLWNWWSSRGAPDVPSAQP